MHMSSLSSRIWHIVTEPSDMLASDERRQQARNLSAVLMLMIVTTVANVVINPSHNAPLLLGVLVVYCVAYGLSRTRYNYVALLIALGVMTTIPVIILINGANYAPVHLAQKLNWLILPVLLCSLVLSFRYAVVFALIVHCGIFALGVFIKDLTVVTLFKSVSLVWITSILILIGQGIRQHYIAYFRMVNHLLTEQTAVLMQEIVEHQRTAEMLRASEARYRTFYEQTPALLHSIDPQGFLINVSDHWLEVMGYERDEVIGRRSTEFLTEESRRYAQAEALPQFFRDGETKNVAYQMVKKNGEIMDVLLSAIVLQDDHGEDVRSLAVLIDVTEQKQVEEAYRTVVDHSLQGFTITQDNRFVFANRAYADMVGRSIDELLALDLAGILEMFHSEDRDEALERYQRREAGTPLPERSMLRLIRKDGSLIWTEIYSSRIDYRGQAAVQTAWIDQTERVQAEDKLAQSEERHRLLLENAGVGIGYFDAEGTILSFNTKALENLGGEASAYVGRSVVDAFGSEWGQELMARIKAALNSPDNRVYEDELPFTQGNKWFLSTFSNIADTTGNSIGVQIIAHDITALKRTEQALHVSEDRFRNLFEHAPVSLWEEDFSDVKAYIDKLRAAGVTDFRAYFDAHPEATQQCASLVKIIDVNEASLHIFRASDKEELLLSLADFFIDKSYDMFKEELVALASQEMRFSGEVSGQPLSGDPIDCRVDLSIAPGAEEDWSKVFVSVRDITESKRAELALEESEKRFRTLVELSPEAIVVHYEGQIVYVNPAGVELLGASSSDDIVGLPAERFVPPDLWPGVQSWMLDIQHDDRMVPFQEQQLVRLNGEVFWAEVTVRSIMYEGRMSSQVIMHDITARKEIEQRERDLIIEREKIRALAEFINDISHDFRTPLTVINTHIYLLRRRLSHEDHLHRLDLMAKYSNRLVHMVDDMFDMFELDLQSELPMTSVNLTPLLYTLANDFRGVAVRKNQTFICNVPNKPQIVWGHANSLGRVVTNLVTNAFQFTDEGDTITLQSQLDDQHIIIEIIDTGIGISKQDLPQIFKRFFRANKTRPTEGGGTGLGLTIAEKIVERHQGRIEVQSVEHEGSTFRVVLPRHTSSANGGRDRKAPLNLP